MNTKDIVSETGVQEVTDKEFLDLNNTIEEVELSSIDNSGTSDEEAKDDYTEKKETDTGSKLSDLVSPSFALNIANIVIPILLMIGFKLIGYRIKKQEFELNSSEKKALEEPLQKYLEHIQVNLNNPTYNLVFALMLIYGAKIAEVFPKAEKINRSKKEIIQEEKEREKEAEIIVQEIVDNEEWANGYTEDQKTLIRATRKRRNRSYQDAIEWLTKKGLL